MWDVIVVGAGPGGSVAAKKCAENGFKTLILEKKKLPRDKVCSGMVAGPWAQDIIRREFGEIPQDVLSSPFRLSGQMFHVPGTEPQILHWPTLIAWRKDLDFWLNQKAQKKGVEIREGVKVTSVVDKGGECTVSLTEDNVRQELKAKFVIGADGAGSAVRKAIFPQLKVRLSVPMRECYEGSLDLDKHYLHWFFPRAQPRPRFNINHKGDRFLLEGRALKELRKEILRILTDFGFDPESTPLWKDACAIPLLHGELISETFSPANGNVLLIGDAAGLLFPITFEGIGTALKSGLSASASITDALHSGRKAAEIYLNELKPIIEVLKRLYQLSKNLEKEAGKGALALAEALKAVYEETLKIV